MRTPKHIRELQKQVDALTNRLTTCPLAVFDEVQAQLFAAQHELAAAQTALPVVQDTSDQDLIIVLEHAVTAAAGPNGWYEDWRGSLAQFLLDNADSPPEMFHIRAMRRLQVGESYTMYGMMSGPWRVTRIHPAGIICSTILGCTNKP